MSTKWKKEYNWHMEDTAQQGGNESQQLFTWFFTLKKIIEAESGMVVARSWREEECGVIVEWV